MLLSSTPTPFNQQVWNATKQIPKGKVATYGTIARMIGRPRSARAVGNALNKNPYAPKVPCHRVVRSSGHVGGFASGSEQKTKMLKSEGIAISNGKVKSLNNFLFTK